MKKLFLKYKEPLSYILWGAVTTLTNYIVYFLCTDLLNINYLISNIIAWSISVAVAFLSNKAFVFHSDKWTGAAVFSELWKFISARLLSVALEMLMLFIFVDLMHISDGVIKMIAGIAVVAINYIFSKLFIFNRK